MTTLFHHAETPRRHALHATMHSAATVLTVIVAVYEASHLGHAALAAFFHHGDKDSLLFSLATVSSAHTVAGATREFLAAFLRHGE